MEVVCVSLPGYIVARQGMFDADKQKFVANLNVALHRATTLPSHVTTASTNPSELPARSTRGAIWSYCPIRALER